MYFIKLTAVAEPKGMFSGRDTSRTFTYTNLDAEPFKFAFENLNPAQFAEYLRHYEIRM